MLSLELEGTKRQHGSKIDQRFQDLNNNRNAIILGMWLNINNANWFKISQNSILIVQYC